MAEMKDLMELQIDVDRQSIKLDGYHKRLGDMEDGCEKRSEKFGERIGNLETKSALYNQQMIEIKEDVKELVKSNQRLQVKVGMIVAIGVVLQFLAGLILQIYVTNKKFSLSETQKVTNKYSAMRIVNDPL